MQGLGRPEPGPGRPKLSFSGFWSEMRRNLHVRRCAVALVPIVIAAPWCCGIPGAMAFPMPRRFGATVPGATQFPARHPNLCPTGAQSSVHNVFSALCCYKIPPNIRCAAKFLNHPPPIAQTEHARGLKFCVVSPHGSLLRVTQAISDKSPLSRDKG